MMLTYQAQNENVAWESFFEESGERYTHEDVPKEGRCHDNAVLNGKEHLQTPNCRELCCHLCCCEVVILIKLLSETT